MKLTEDGIVILVNDEQKLKEYDSILVTEEGIIISANELHLLNDPG